ncbi:MAG TPA: hypothetical protein VJK53_04865 [Candidatus Paceibacterota bacterium]
MEDKEAIEILKKMLQKHSCEGEEKEAVHTAIGILGWTKLIEGRVKTIKKARERRMREDE